MTPRTLLQGTVHEVQERTYGQGKTMLNLILAVEVYRYNAELRGQEKTTAYYELPCFGRNVTTVASLRPGDPVMVDAEVVAAPYQKDGQTRWMLKLEPRNIAMLPVQQPPQQPMYQPAPQTDPWATEAPPF